LTKLDRFRPNLDVAFEGIEVITFFQSCLVQPEWVGTYLGRVNPRMICAIAVLGSRARREGKSSEGKLMGVEIK
jgi:hypothetical protein